MSVIKRRHFLQLAGSVLATLGWSQIEFQQQALRYAKVLAQETRRKRALLVGINKYVNIGKYQWYPLKGAVNDAKLQKELLIHRFGFAEDDILTLTDKDATRENILKNLESHLIKWAQPGDVVVFHFSGHGSQVADPDKVFQDGRVSTVVPIDSPLPPGYPNKGGEVKDITGHTLWLLMQAINTENLTFVLDSCYSGGARKGVLTVRSRPGDLELLRLADPSIQLIANPQEQEYQKELISRLKIDRSKFGNQRRGGIPKGVMLAAAKRKQTAYDTTFTDINAGVFTYVLTRYLWQETGSDSVSRVMGSTSSTTQRILQKYFPTSGLVQQPEYNIRQGSNNGKEKVYFSSRQKIPAEGVVTKVQGNQVDLFLGGIDPESLDAFGRGATFTLVDRQGQEQGQIEIQSRRQLNAQGKVIQVNSKEVIIPGTLLQEQWRAIPRNLTLRIGLDPSLGQEIQSAKQALGAIKGISPVTLQQEVQPEQEVEYILGRVSQSYHQQLQELKVKNLPEIGSIGLFSPAMDLIPNSAGIPEEKVTDGISRLQAKLKSLLAARLVKLTLNTNSSRLSVAAAMETVDGKKVVGESFTVRGAKIQGVSKTRGTIPVSSNVEKFKSRTQVQFVVKNNQPRDLYISVLLISADGELSVLSPLTSNAVKVRAGRKIYIPDPNRGERYQFRMISKISGIAEVLVIATTTPLTRAIQLLQTLAAKKPKRQGSPVDLNQDPVEVITSLLDDLDQATRGSGKNETPGVRRVDARQMAALSITFEVVN